MLASGRSEDRGVLELEEVGARLAVLLRFQGCTCRPRGLSAGMNRLRLLLISGHWALMGRLF